ncbi:hypothetical protein BV22DRAFT_1130177 [Leucogyrophana mollusca]|uniref:Uncharacterized protein n=1 Tax=Leucogyrophana mollusca TaxID=85980 RepID=A0ACB8BF60_9AGAM|nr:hypothetical protein BV22DRAFT_1130177 [Leucogyrophana mollusca]
MSTSEIVIASRLQIVKYFKVSGLAVLAIDYCINLDTEVTLTWNRSWSFVRVLFVLARYLPFLDVPVDLYYSSIPKSTALCLPLYQAASWINVVGTVTAEALLLVRTWVLWGRSKIVLAGLVALAAVCIAGSGVVGAIAVRSMTFGPPPLSTSGCYQTHSVSIYAWDYAILAFFELVILLLTGYQAFRHLRHSHSLLILRLYGDGIFYVLCILVMSTVNIVVISALPNEYAELIDTLQAVMHSVLASRLLFNLRKIMREQHIVISNTSQPTDVDTIPMFVAVNPEAVSGSFDVASWEQDRG